MMSRVLQEDCVLLGYNVPKNVRHCGYFVSCVYSLIVRPMFGIPLIVLGETRSCSRTP